MLGCASGGGAPRALRNADRTPLASYETDQAPSAVRLSMLFPVDTVAWGIVGAVT